MAPAARSWRNRDHGAAWEQEYRNALRRQAQLLNERRQEATMRPGPRPEAPSRAPLVPLVRQRAEPWRALEEQWLDGKLAALDSPFRESLDGSIGALREENRDLPGVHSLSE